MSEYIDSIDRELARRAGGGLPFSFVVYGGHPSSMVDVEAATKAIIADADNRAAGTGDRIYITSAIHEAVVDDIFISVGAFVGVLSTFPLDTGVK